jgi:MFS transporter, DHA2 family, multidrug resistance protein
MYKRGLYHDWVPKPLQLLLIIVTILPFMAVSCVYPSNIIDMSSGMGEISEAFSFANNALYVGMAGALPLLIRTKPYFRTKEVVAGGLVIMSLLCYVSSTTDNVWVIAFASLLMGFFKMFGTIEFILPIFFIITPTMDRKRFYPTFYPIAIIVGQYAGFYMGALAYRMFWEYTYLVAIIYCLTCALLALVFMHNSRSMKKVPFYQFHWTSLFLFFAMMMVLNYVLTFTKFHGWFQSEVIWWGLVAFFIMLALFVAIQRSIKRPFMEMEGFTKRNVIHSLIMIALMGLFVSCGSMQNTYMMGVLGYSSLLTNQINLAMFPGAIIGGVICFFWLRYNLDLKELVIIGFGSYVVAHIILYFTIAPEVQVGFFILPTILKGVGLCVLYISLAIYCSQRLTNNQMLSAMAILVMVRSFVGQALFGSILSWALYKLQLQNVTNLASHMDAVDFMGQLRGGSLMLYKSAQLQAIMLAVKQLLGYTIIAGFVILTYIALHRFGSTRYRRIVIIRKRLKGYKADRRKKNEEQAIEDVASVAM